MSNISTYNQLLTVLEDAATRHYQINSFVIGADWEIGADMALTYPLLAVRPVNSTMKRGSNSNYAAMEVTMNLKVLDLVDKDETNENDVVSDSLQILQDIVTEFASHPYYVNSGFEIIGDLTFDPLDEVTDEACSGWEVKLTMRTPFKSSFCGIPMSEIPDFSFPAPDNTGLQVIGTQYITDIQNTDGNIQISHSGQIYTINASGITTNAADITSLDDLKYDKTGGAISGSVHLQQNVYFTDKGTTIVGATTTFDLSTGNIFINTLAGVTEMDYNNPQVGTYIWEFNGQTTSSVLTFAAGKFQSPDGTTPVLTATAGAIDMITGYYNGSKMVIIPANNITDLV